MTVTRPSVVFDCNVLLQAAAREHGPAADCLRLVETGEIALYVSRPILREVRRILADDKVRASNPLLTDERVDSFIRRLIFRGHVIRQVRHVFTFPRDPKDEPYINLAAAVDARYLVSRDKDLLDLSTDHDAIARAFRRQFHKLTVLSPTAFLDEMRSGPKPT